MILRKKKKKTLGKLCFSIKMLKSIREIHFLQKNI